MRVLIAAGGTAGHINPALAIAGALKAAEPTAEIHFAGRREGMEYGLVTKAGYPFHHIEINGFQRRLNAENIVRNVIALWHLALSGPRTQKILNEVKPDLVIGCGGYVSGPVVRRCQARHQDCHPRAERLPRCDQQAAGQGCGCGTGRQR